MSPIILKDQTVFPDFDVLKKAMRTAFALYEQLLAGLAELEVTPEWNYYKDGKVWLAKMLHKKKNLGWVAVYDGSFSVTFYVTEKYVEAIAALDLTPQIKEDFFRAKPAGKLIPIIFYVTDPSALNDALTLVRFKKEAK